MGAPLNYNDFDTIFRIDPTTMFTLATADIPPLAHAIAEAIGAIQAIWRDLQVGWAGRSADEAQAFVARWNTAVGRLFGTEADPDSGAVMKIAEAVAIAAVNFGVAEDTVVRMFSSLTSGMQAPPGQVGPPVRNHQDGPITQHADAPA